MQTHKNPNLREGPTPYKTPTQFGGKAVAPVAPVEKAPVFTREGKKWLIEHQKNNSGLLVENAEMNNVVYMFKGLNSTLTVKGKINSVVIDSCKKCSVVCDSLVSSVEFVNCQSVQMQVSLINFVFLEVTTIFNPNFSAWEKCQLSSSIKPTDVKCSYRKNL